MEKQLGPGIFEDIDDDTAKLIIQLQLEDAENIAVNSADGIEAPNGNLSDYDVALKLYLDEMQRNAAVLQDRGIAEAVGRGLEPNDDGLLIINPADGGLAADEFQASDQITQPAEDAQAAQLVVDADGEALTTVLRAHALGNNRESAGDAPACPRHPCTVCMDTFLLREIIIVGCGHGYCNPCLKETFTRSFMDEELFPPRYVFFHLTLHIWLAEFVKRMSGVLKRAFDFRLKP